MPAADYGALLRGKVDARRDLECTSHRLDYRAGTWELLRIASAEIRPFDPVMVVRATIHGDEIAGALTLLDHLDELVDHAHGRGVKLIVYPLGNPSGFEHGLRYNVDHHMGEGNNDFLRYVLADDSVESDMGAGRPFARWAMADDPAFGVDLPAESRLMLELVRQDPPGQVVAALDLHQDYLTGLPPCAYHYAFGDLERYAGIAARIADVVPLLAGYDMSGGFGEQIDEHGTVLPQTDKPAMRSDDRGFIVRHDASFSDYYQLVGARHSIAPETSGSTPMDQAMLVNRLWFTGVVDLVADESPHP
jgi:hypothetical protein